MQTLVFNTTTKEVVLLSGTRGDSKVLETFDNISTVKCIESGFYEIMQKQDSESNSSIPVMRVPIANTNMIIKK
jgi:phosphoglycerate dehydrogenase-like enzyme